MDPVLKGGLIAGGVLGAAVCGYSIFWWIEGRVLEKPKYDVVELLQEKRWLWRKSRIELRAYGPMLIAEATVTDLPLRESMGEGFKKVAKFIFGGNKAAQNNTKSESIAMTAPVRMSMPEGQSTKIAMTAPVRTEIASSDESSGSSKSVYKISFTMPSKYTKETLPVPDNSELEIKEVPPHRAVAITFGGPSPSAQVIESKRQELLAAAKEHGLTTKGDVLVYQYHPPFAPSFVRLNEVLYEIEDKDTDVAAGDGKFLQ